MTQELIGQILGFVATAIIASCYQANTKKGLLMIQSVGIVFLCASYLLLGATSGFVLNIICLIRNLTFYFLKEKTPPHYVATAILMIAMCVAGVFSWESLISLLLIVALVANTFFISLGKPQILRYSIVVTSTLCLIYNVAVFSMGGTLNEAITIFSAIVGSIRFLRAKRAEPVQKSEV